MGTLIARRPPGAARGRSRDRTTSSPAATGATATWPRRRRTSSSWTRVSSRPAGTCTRSLAKSVARDDVAGRDVAVRHGDAHTDGLVAQHRDAHDHPEEPGDHHHEVARRHVAAERPARRATGPRTGSTSTSGGVRGRAGLAIDIFLPLVDASGSTDSGVPGLLHGSCASVNPREPDTERLRTRRTWCLPVSRRDRWVSEGFPRCVRCVRLGDGDARRRGARLPPVRLPAGAHHRPGGRAAPGARGVPAAHGARRPRPVPSLPRRPGHALPARRAARVAGRAAGCRPVDVHRPRRRGPVS